MDEDTFANEVEWVFEYVMNLFRSPSWEVPIMSFIDENCAIFDDEDENKFAYTEVHERFKELVEDVLTANLSEIGISSQDFADICEQCRYSNDFSINVINQILSMDDFITFKKLMLKRNMELELEAVRALQLDAKLSEDKDYDIYDHYQEIELLRKQEELEHADLEDAIEFTLAYEEERQRLFGLDVEGLNDEYVPSSSPKKRSAVEEMEMLIAEKKEEVVDSFRKNQIALEEKRKRHEEIKQKAEITQDQLYERSKHLQAQRERLLAKKQKEREKQLQKYKQEQKEILSSSSSSLKADAKSYDEDKDEPSEDKLSEEDERRKALRLALGKRMKQDLIQNEEEETMKLQIQKFTDLDVKMKQVEMIRQENQKKEEKAYKEMMDIQYQRARNVKQPGRRHDFKDDDFSFNE